MAKCLYCESEYKAKKSTSRYCSDSCRVMYNRKNKKTKPTEGVTKAQMQVLYNQMLELAANLNDKVTIQRVNPMTEKEAVAMHNHMHPNQHTSLFEIKGKSFDQYEQEKLECELPEQWASLSKQISNDPHLNQKQKNYLLNKR